MTNIILNADSYKASHFKQYPEGTSQVSSYIEPRGGQYDKALFFGLQMFIKQYLTTPLTHQDVDDAKTILEAHGVPFHEAGWRHIVDKHQGLLPIKIQALSEGSVVPISNALVQVINTDPKCAWLTSYVETALLRAIWYPTTVATVSYHCKQIIQQYLAETADSLDGLEFKLHDFGARGATTEEAAAVGGAAHLLNFMGTDTLSAIVAARRFYDATMPGFSIPAAEHSTITAWGKNGEKAAYENMLKQFSGPGKLVAVVSDSYDLWHAIDNIWGDELKEQVEQTGGTLVIRPDSGEPVEVVTKTIEKLMVKFGYRINSKGYRVLPDCVRVIQGDGIAENSIREILHTMKTKQQSAENIAFGMGGALLQKLDRDTMQFAMKASAVKVKGLWHDVFKDPITDHGKRSKKGRLAVVHDKVKGMKTIRESDLGNRENLLKTVFKNGQLLIEHSFDEIKANIR